MFRRVDYLQDRSTRCHNPENHNRNIHRRKNYSTFIFPQNIFPQISVCSTSDALLYCRYSTYANMVSHSSLIYKHLVAGLCQQVNTCTPPVYLHVVVLGHWNCTKCGSGTVSRPGYRRVTQQKWMSEWMVHCICQDLHFNMLWPFPTKSFPVHHT